MFIEIVILWGFNVVFNFLINKIKFCLFLILMFLKLILILLLFVFISEFFIDDISFFCFVLLFSILFVSILLKLLLISGQIFLLFLWVVWIYDLFIEDEIILLFDVSVNLWGEIMFKFFCFIDFV